MIILYAQGADQYVSFDSFIVMRRCKNIQTPGGNKLDGRWGLFHNGTLCDWGQNRNDLAERNELKLTNQTLDSKWEEIQNVVNQQNQSRPSTSP